MSSIPLGIYLAGIPGPDDSPDEVARQQFFGTVAFA
jgi:hypothetical protein